MDAVRSPSSTSVEIFRLYVSIAARSLSMASTGTNPARMAPRSKPPHPQKRLTMDLGVMPSSALFSPPSRLLPQPCPGIDRPVTKIAPQYHRGRLVVIVDSSSPCRSDRLPPEKRYFANPHTYRAWVDSFGQSLTVR